MKILALDTSSPTGSVGIADKDRNLAEINSGMTRTHASQVMPMIDMALKLADCELRDLDLLAVVEGPGTFTGLRIGAAITKALALAYTLPIAGVSSLKALAWQAAVDGFIICPLIDARRGDVYGACYHYSNNCLNMIAPPCTGPPQQVVASVSKPCILVGSGARLYQKLLVDILGPAACLAPLGQHTIRASSVARLGWHLAQQRLLTSATAFTPVYLRKTDAEMRLKPV